MFAEAAWYTAIFYDALVLPGALLVGLSGLSLTFEPGFPVCRLPNADHVSVSRMRQASDGLDPPVRLPTAAI